MKCFLNVFVVVFVLNCLKLSNGFNVMDKRSSEEDTHSINYKELFNTIPEEDRENFIRSHLAIALNTDSAYSIDIPEEIGVDQGEFEDIMEQSDYFIDGPQALSNEAYEFPDEFSSELLTWTQKEFNLTKNDVYRMVVFSQVCFPSGCVNPGDIGGLCCPF